MNFKVKQICECSFGNEINDILASYGVNDIDGLINPSEKYIESPYLFSYINAAVECFTKHIKFKSDIDLLVDCDCDGYTSASVMYQYIKQISPDTKINVFIHKKKAHGLADVLDDMLVSSGKLVIIPDASSSDEEECRKLFYQKNKEIIILDHHNQKPTDNPAIIVNNQLSKGVTDKAMTGGGIVYKFCKLLDGFYKVNYADDYLDLLAIGMIGDRCDMFNLQSRYYIFEGIKQIKNNINKNKLISVMIESASYSMNNKITVNGLAFYVCPLINALIRLGEMEDKVYLFEAMCNSDKMLDRKVKGKGIVNMTIQEYVLRAAKTYNDHQRKLTEESTEKLVEKIEMTDLNKYPILVGNAGEDVDTNSTGLIANKLVSIYKKPCLLMRRFDDKCVGSARGYDKSSIHDIQKWLNDTGLFFKADGHENACGIGISLEKTYDLFNLLASMPTDDILTYYVCNTYNDKNINDMFIKNIAKYDWIWGTTVEEPLFYITDIPCDKYNINLVGAKQDVIQFTYHNIKFIKRSKGKSLSALY